MVSIPGVTFIFASLDGRLDLSDNFDLPCSFSRFIQRYNVERAIPHRRAVFVTEPVSVYIPSHFWRIRIFRISSFMPRRYRLRFVYEKKNCSVSIDTLQVNQCSADHIKAEKKLLEEHSKKLAKHLQKNEGIWLSSFWTKIMMSFFIFYTILLLIYAYIK